MIAKFFSKIQLKGKFFTLRGSSSVDPSLKALAHGKKKKKPTVHISIVPEIQSGCIFEGRSR
jgi:hypothetical protein